MDHRAEGHKGGSHERWLVSYADFVTLLFAFFVVLYANAQTDTEKTRALAESFRAAMGDQALAAQLAKLFGTPGTKIDIEKPKGDKQSDSGPAADASKSVDLLPTMQELNKNLEQELKSGRMEITLERRGLVISLHEAGAFPSGEANLLAAAHEPISLVAKALRPLPNPIRLEGHTDSVPIHNAHFRSNWELSAARSIALMEMFSTDFDIPRNRISIAGFAETAPVAANDSDKGRARNRRVDIVVLTAEGAISNPTAYQPKPELKVEVTKAH